MKITWVKAASKQWHSDDGRYTIWVEANERREGRLYGVKVEGEAVWLTDQAGTLGEAKLIAQEHADEHPVEKPVASEPV